MDSFLVVTQVQNSGRKYFSKLDLSQAYHQLELEEESRPFATTREYTSSIGCLSGCPQHQEYFRGLWKRYLKIIQDNLGDSQLVVARCLPCV